MKKMVITVILVLMVLLGSVSCSKVLSNNTTDDIYLRCNATSQGNMVEIESGFYYLLGNQLFYADRSDMTNWVAVCNKPDCMHKWNEEYCYANVGYDITQKDGKVYFYKEDIYPDQGYIYQVAKDGSEPIKVFKIPLDYKGSSSGSAIISQAGFFIYQETLNEEGMYETGIYRLEEDETMHTLFFQKNDKFYSEFNIPSYANHVRGDFTIMSTLLIEPDDNVENVLFRVDGDTPERVILPEDVSVLWSYLTEDTFTYYKSNQGFFKIDLETQTETNIMKNQLKDARGYILTNDYLIECNRYQGNTPQYSYLRFYDGSKWIDVALPELIKKTDCYFAPISVATDRVFLKLMNGSLIGNGVEQLYYFMLDEENPTLTLAKTFGDESSFKMIESEEELDIIHKVDVTIFDTEEYTAKLTEVGFGFIQNNEYNEEIPNAFSLTVCFENKTDKILTMHNNNWSINGVSMSGNATTVKPYEKVEETYNKVFSGREVVDWGKKLTSFLVASFVTDETFQQLGPATITEIYPYGKENATIQERESLITDEVLIDNEYIQLTAIKYWQPENKNATIEFVVENKTDSMVLCGVNEIISINGQSLNKDIGGLIELLPKSYSYLEIEIFDDWFKYDKIKEMVGDEVKEYSVNFCVYEQSLMPEEVGQFLFEEFVLLKSKR